MTDGTGMSVADVAALSNGGFGGGWGDGGAFMWIFALLILANGGFGGFGNNGNTNAIQADVNRGFDNQNLQAQTRDILSAVTNGTAQTIAATHTRPHGFNFRGMHGTPRRVSDSRMPTVGRSTTPVAWTSALGMDRRSTSASVTNLNRDRPARPGK